MLGTLPQITSKKSPSPKLASHFRKLIVEENFCFFAVTWEPCIVSFVYMSALLTRCTVRMWRISSAWLINFLQTCGEQKTPSAWKGNSTHLVLFVFAQKTDKFRFVVNGMRNICGWRSAGSQSCPHIRAFGSRAVRKPFGVLVYTRLYRKTFRIKNILQQISHKKCSFTFFISTHSYIATGRWSSVVLIFIHVATLSLLLYCVTQNGVKRQLNQSTWNQYLICRLDYTITTHLSFVNRMSPCYEWA